MLEVKIVCKKPLSQVEEDSFSRMINILKGAEFGVSSDKQEMIVRICDRADKNDWLAMESIMHLIQSQIQAKSLKLHFEEESE